jgi:hypothetical protein
LTSLCTRRRTVRSTRNLDDASFERIVAVGFSPSVLFVTKNKLVKQTSVNMGDEEETQVDEHLDPEDEIAFENAAPDEDDSGDAGSDYGSDEDYDDDKVRSLDGDGAREESGAMGWIVVGSMRGIG